MVTWTWTREIISADDILDAARTIRPGHSSLSLDLTHNWIPARRYLDWAHASLLRGGEDAWDTASSLSKRAVCRQMDGILANNHLGHFLGRNYERKANYLQGLGVPGLNLVRDLVIDPRNDIEHAYEIATKSQAEQACELADLFLRATDAEGEMFAIITLGWKVGYQESVCVAPGKEHHVVQLSLTKEHDPMLIIHGYPEAPQAMIVNAAEESLRVCPLKDFSPEQVMILNNEVRKCTGCRSIGDVFSTAMREQLKLQP